MLKTKTFLQTPHKTTSKHPIIQEFWLYFAKKFVILDKNEKSAPTQLAPPVQAYACGNVYFEHLAKFPDFFEAQCWQPWIQVIYN